MTGVNMTHVPYRGSPPANVDLMSGQVQVMFDTWVGSIPHIRSGTHSCIGWWQASSRLDVLPDAPRVADTVPGFEVSGWNGFAVRKGVPAGIIERLNYRNQHRLGRSDSQGKNCSSDRRAIAA